MAALQCPAYLVHLVRAALHHLVGVDAVEDGSQALPLLPLAHPRVDVVDEVLHRTNLQPGQWVQEAGGDHPTLHLLPYAPGPLP